MTGPVIHFAPFALDQRAAELRRQGVKVRLPQQSFQILLMLLHSPGEVVLREQIRAALWPDGTVVEFDHSINAAIKNLRTALGDSATAPRYIETVGRQGYRFIAEIDAAPYVPPPIEQRPAAPRLPIIRATASMAAVAAAGASLAIWLSASRGPEPSFEPAPLTAYAGSEWQPSFSPEGNQVVFTRRKGADEPSHLHVKVVGVGESIPLTSDDGEHRLPTWSPDGKWIAFIGRHKNGHAGIYRIPALGGPESRLADDAWVDSLDWSPDGRWLVAAPHPRVLDETGIVLFSADTGERREMGRQDPELRRASQPRFSPDGRRLAYIRGKMYQTQVFVADLTPELRLAGKPKQITADELGALDPHWTADGLEIVYQSGISSSSSFLKRVPADGGSSPRKIPGLSDATSFAISRNGRRLAFDKGNNDQDIWRYDLTGATRPSRWASSTRYENNAVYSPDGKRIAMSSNRSGGREIWVTDADGRNEQQFTHFGGPLAGSPRWSPDGKWIAFDARPEGDSEIYVISAEGSGIRRLTRERGEDARPAWSHDGKWIYYASERGGRSEIWRMPGQGGAPPEQITRGGAVCALASPDGQWIYYKPGHRTGPLGYGPGWNEVEELRKIRPDGSGDSIAVDANIAGMGFAPTPHGLWFINYRGAGATVELLGVNGRRSTLLELPYRPENGFSLTPDERYLLITRPDGKGMDLFFVEGFR